MNVTGGVTAPRERGRRRWAVHLAWFVLVILAFWAGTHMGFRVYRVTLGTMTTQNTRSDHMAQIRMSLRLMDEKDLEAHRHSEDGSLRQAVIGLTGLPRYTECNEKESEALIKAREYLSETHTKGLAHSDLYSDGLSYCDKPIEKWPRILPW